MCARGKKRVTLGFPFVPFLRLPDAVRAVCAANKNALARREMRDALVHSSARFKLMNAVEVV